MSKTNMSAEDIFAYHFDKGDKMDRCANTEALNRYLSGEELLEEAQEAFFDDADEILAGIQELAEQLKKLADGYDHGNQTYDFTDEVKSLIMEVI